MRLSLWLGAGLGLGLARLALEPALWHELARALTWASALLCAFGAALNCVLGLDYGFGLGFAPYVFALDLLLLQTPNLRANEALSNTIHQCMTRGGFTATTAPLLPPCMFFCKRVLF